jgi:tetratricopeptide (TPR) repeat protein
MVTGSIRFVSLVLLVAQLRAANPEAVAEAARGTALAKEGKYDLAIQHYRAALRLDSHLPGLYLNLGLAYFKSKRLSDAAKAFEEAVSADGNSLQARATRYELLRLRALCRRGGSIETGFAGTAR